MDVFLRTVSVNKGDTFVTPYCRFLTVALEKMELADPPTKKDEENCNVKYKIEPSGQRDNRGLETNKRTLPLCEGNLVL